MKKIALLIGEISSEFQSGLVESMYKKALEYDYQLHAFVVYGIFGMNALHSFSEMSSLQVPDLDSYDAVMVAPNTFEIDNIYQSFKEQTLNKLSCPVICIRSEDSDYPSIVYDECQTMRTMVEHFVDYHRMKKVYYVSGPLDRLDSQERLNGYRQVMSEHRIPVTEKMIFYGNFWKNQGKAIIDHFIPSPEDYPQAIVCANDYMAEAVVTELHNRGYRIPEDICVSGFDDLEEVMLLTPPLTSIHIDINGMGIKAMELLHNILEGIPTPKKILHPSTPVYRGSCGCPYAHDSVYTQMLFNRLTNMQFILGNIVNQSTDFANIATYDNLVHTTIPYVSNCNLNKIYVCFCDEAEKNREQAEMSLKFTEKMLLRTILKRDGFDSPNITFSRNEILPKEYLDTIKFPIVSSMISKDRYMGYFVADCGDISNVSKMQYMFRSWIQQFSAAVSRVQLYEENQILSRVWEINNHDELTGILNRRGIENYIQRVLVDLHKQKKIFCVISTDMDGLKYINDHFGHSEGDNAITTYANILSSAIQGLGEVARVGGDEFLLCGICEEKNSVEELLTKIHASIAEYNNSSQKPYEISGSFGYEFCSPEQPLGEAIRIADKKMYAEKATHKHNRI